MINKVLDFAIRHHMFERNDYVVAGVSGGADSVCLLFVLLELKKIYDLEINVVHVNHLIRQEAGEDAEYVQKLCGQYGLAFTLVERDVEKIAEKQRISTEEAGRNVRYEAFYNALGKRKGKIAVAHNKNDCCETFLFNLFRGSSLKGLSGIRPVRGEIVRPLMCLERTEIEDFLRERNVKFCIDATNFEDNYTRNKIRHHILKTAQSEISPAVVSHISDACERLGDAYDLIEELADKAYGECVAVEEHKGGTCGVGAGGGRLWHINAERFGALHDTLKGYVAMKALAAAAGSRKDIGAVHIRQLIELFGRQCGRSLNLPYGIMAVRTYEGVTVGKKEAFEKTAGAYPPIELTRQRLEGLKEGERLSFEWGGQGKIEFSLINRSNLQNIEQKKYTKWFDYGKIKDNIVVRTRKTGDFITINQSNQHKTLKSYFADEKTAARERDSICLIAENSHILWVVGGRISNYYKVSEDTRLVLQAEFTQYDTKEAQEKSVFPQQSKY